MPRIEEEDGYDAAEDDELEAEDEEEGADMASSAESAPATAPAGGEPAAGVSGVSDQRVPEREGKEKAWVRRPLQFR